MGFQKAVSLLLGIFILGNLDNVKSQIGSRIRDSLQECTEDSFIQDVGKCFFGKFEDLLPNRYTSSFSYSQELFNTGRHPLSVHMNTELKDSSIRYNYILPQMSKRLSGTHKQLLDVIYTAGQAALEKERQFMALEKLRHINLQELVYKYITEVMEHNIAPYLGYLNTHSKYTVFQEFDSMDKIRPCDDVCNGRPPFFGCIFCVIELIMDTLPGLVDSVECLSQYSATDFEDGVQWIKCFYNCEDLIPISGCIKDQFAQCGEWSVVGDVIIKGFAEFTDLGTCMLNVVSERNITLVEGGDSATVSFYNYMPPAAHCLDFQSLSAPLGMIRALGSVLGIIMGDAPECSVQVQMSLQNYWHDLLPHVDNFPGDIITAGRPKCHDRSALRQSVVGYHEYNNNTMETCVVLITEENWNETFNVPIWASVDLKNDGNVSTDFALKLMVDGRVKHNERLSVEIVDTDLQGSTLCQSSGDPHITTFDGHYYNNLYEGYFYLYKNTFLPYEVQVIYQKCTPEALASCTCAVAVKSGDDVFVVDKCRRTGQTNADTVMRTALFVNGDVTPGTRVFSKSRGAEMQVILPTGLTASVVTSNDALSVYLNPSNYDLEQTLGLCGFFDGNAANDLMFENGTIYDGDGSEERGQPRPFSQAWRVAENDRIFEGVAPEDEPDDIGRYCKCNHVVFQGVQCTCGPGELVETCDMDLSGELTEQISALVRKSRKSTDLDSNIGMDDIEVDEDFEPPELEWNPGVVWNESHATEFCSNLISNESTNTIILECVKTQGDVFVEEAKWHCVEDIQITDSADWQHIAIESAKRKCSAHYLRGIDLGDEYLNFNNDTCLNDCNGRGPCLNGSCKCNEGWMGGDCSMAKNEPQIVMDDSSMCDTRTEDCSYATIFGKYFPQDSSLACHLKEAKMKSSGEFDISGDNDESEETLYISPYQIACKLPSARSYEITLEWNGQEVAVMVAGKPDVYSNSFIFMVYDSACYDCSLDDQKCQERGPVDGVTDHCMISSDCYAPGQAHPDDDCRYCNNTQKDDDWTWYTDEVCEAEKEEYIEEKDKEKTEKIIRISIAVILTVLIILLTVGLYIRKNKNREIEIDKDIKPEEGDIKFYKSTTGYVNDGMQLNEVKHPKIVPPQVQRVIEEETGHESRLSSVSSIGSAGDLTSAKKAALEKRKKQSRTDSTCSSTSVRSIGLGAAGPVQYSHYNKVIDDNMEHIKGIGGHGSPALPTRSNQHKGLHVNAVY